MFLRKLFLSGAALIATGVSFVLVGHGVFRKVEWKKGSMDEIEFVYVEHKGPYKNIGEAFENLVKLLADTGVTVTKTSHTYVGVYLDDPCVVAPEELSARAGVVLNTEDAKKSGLPSHKYAAQETLTTVFPYISHLSIIMSVLKCYPALTKAFALPGNEKYAEGACIEVYEKSANTITFHALKPQA